MLVKDLIDLLIRFDQNLPVFDWDGEPLTYVKLKEAEKHNIDRYVDIDLPRRIEIG
jgi:hypothetical protein